MATRRTTRLGFWFTLAVICSIVDAGGFCSTGGAPFERSASRSDPVRGDDLKHPLGARQRMLRDRALQNALQGRGPRTGVAEVAQGQFVELDREKEDSIWTVLGQFSDLAHNQIPKPDRKVDNSTIWEKDFSRAYFLKLLFSGKSGDISMRNYYIEQSSGRYTVNGDVTDWVTVPGAGATYGATDPQAWDFVADSVDGWYASQLAAGKTAAGDRCLPGAVRCLGPLRPGWRRQLR